MGHFLITSPLSSLLDSTKFKVQKLEKTGIELSIFRIRMFVIVKMFLIENSYSGYVSC